MIYELRSPKPSKIQKMFLNDGDHVNSGNPIARVDSYQEEMALIQLMSLKETTKAKLTSFTGAYFTSRLDRLKQIAGLRKGAVTSTGIDVDATKEKAADGTLIYDYLVPVRKSEYTAKLDLQRAEIERDQYQEMAKSASLHTSEIIRLIEIEERLINDRMEKLTIRAPVSGRCKLFVAPGATVSRGYLIASIS